MYQPARALRMPAVALLVAACAPDSPSTTAFVGGQLIDGTGSVPVANATMLVRNGRITAIGPATDIAVPSGAEVVDITGYTVMPGLINTHGHLSGVLGLENDHYTTENLLRQLALYARYGVTTVNSLGGDGPEAFALRNGQATDSLRRARLFLAGSIVTGTTADAVRTEVDANAALGVDFIKFRVDDNLGTTLKMPLPAIEALIGRAHEHGLDVATHIYYLEDAKTVLRAGSDFIAHSVRDDSIDQEFVELLEARDICYSPTLTREVSTFVYEDEPPFFSDPFFLRDADPAVLAQLRDPARQSRVRDSPDTPVNKRGLEQAKRNLKALSDRGITIAFGTDTGPAARFQGYFEHLELELMAEAGMAADQIIRAATGDAARCIGRDDIGTLESGKWADFVVLTEDPLADILNLRAIESVYVAGHEVER